MYQLLRHSRMFKCPHLNVLHKVHLMNVFGTLQVEKTPRTGCTQCMLFQHLRSRFASISRQQIEPSPVHSLSPTQPSITPTGKEKSTPSSPLISADLPEEQRGVVNRTSPASFDRTSIISVMSQSSVSNTALICTELEVKVSPFHLLIEFHVGNLCVVFLENASMP